MIWYVTTLLKRKMFSTAAICSTNEKRKTKKKLVLKKCEVIYDRLLEHSINVFMGDLNTKIR